MLVRRQLQHRAHGGDVTGGQTSRRTELMTGREILTLLAAATITTALIIGQTYILCTLFAAT